MEIVQNNLDAVILLIKETRLIGGLAILLFTAIAAKILDLFIAKVLRALVKKSRFKGDDTFIEIAHRPIINTILLAGVVSAVNWIEIDPQIKFVMSAFLKTAILIVVVCAIYNLLKEIFVHLRKINVQGKIFINLAENLGNILLTISGLAIFLGIWAINITPIVASAGVLSLAVAFAAKDTIANFFGGINIFVDRPFEAGDYIVLESGERGAVVEVGVRSTIVLTRDDLQISIPNAVIANSKIINESAPEPRFRIRIKIGAAYGSDIDHVENVLIGIADSNEEITSFPEPRVRFRAFGDSSLDFELLCWAKNPADRGRITHELNKKVYKEFNKNKIIIPFPQMDVYIHPSA
ncbi:MAG TPA: mechanosensitive ion channel family protein [Desulfobacteraceae bacterium]|nr:mechanosensitive ion channel family protein [Desulfobacteraceae bacterium]